MKLTTKKIEAGKYRIIRDGCPTNLTIEKGAPPRYREQQEWFVCPADRPGDFHFETRGKDLAITTIQAVLRDLAVETHNG